MTWKTARTAVLVAGIFLLLPRPHLAAESHGAAVALFDTNTPSPVPLASQAIASRAGWTRLPEDETAARFRGDAVLSNGRLTVVFRRNGPGAELYSHGKHGPTPRAVLTPAVDERRARLASVAVAENTTSAAAVDATFRMLDGGEAAVRFELQLGQVFVKTEPRRNVQAMRLESPCHSLILPDFFADDLVVDAAELPPGDAELPGENFLLHPVGQGDALVLAVWDKGEEDIQVAVVGEGDDRRFRTSRIPYGDRGSVYVAVLEGPAVWHRHDVYLADADRVIPLDWKAPFPAQWRVDWRQDDGLTDSWEMLLEGPDGNYAKPDWFGQPANYGTDDWMPGGRKRWTTVLGFFQYPCWIDQQGRGFLQPLKEPGNFQGPALVYPINRVAATPLEALTLVDLVRATLGVGPCQYVLDVEGQKKQSAGIPTCDARAKLDAIYAAGMQRQKRAEVEQALDDCLAFIRHIRARIEEYLSFGHEMLAYLDEQNQARPELAEFLEEMDRLTRRIDAAVAARKDGIHTPEHATRLVDEFRTTLVDYRGDDALARCKKLTAGFVEIGGNQDELVGECRMAVRILRQKAALAMAFDPRTAEIAKEIRRRTQAILRNPTSYEAPRH